jgi:Zn finger protein HypA/HybF involved in hydrogenase expression
VNQENLKTLQTGMTEVSRLLFPFLLIWLLGAIGLGWLVKSLLILFALLLVAPIAIFIGFRWWLKRNLIQAECPVCQYEFVSLNQSEFRCPNCSEPLKAEQGHFTRLVPPGTIDVSAVEVTVQKIED